jgi:YVTN family beta-propeller protein
MIRVKFQALVWTGFVVAGCLLAGCGDESTGPDYPNIDPIVYSQHIQPVLNASCNTFLCHNADDHALGLSLATYSDLQSGSDFGAMIVPFEPDRSHFYLHLTGAIEPIMPLGLNPLAPEVVTFLRRWIDEGAPNDGGTPMYANVTRKVFVACQGENTVAAVDLETGLSARHLEIDQPHSVYADPMTHRLYVSRFETATNNLQMFDGDTYEFLAARHAGTFPALMQVARPAGFVPQLWVTNFGTTDHAVRVYDPESLSPIFSAAVPSGEQPHGLAINAAETRVYVTNILTDNLTVFGTDPPRVLEQDIRLPPAGPGGHEPQQCLLSPDGTRLYVSALKSDKVFVLDTTDLTTPVWTAEIEVGDGPWHLTVSPDGTRLWVANWLGESLSIVDVSNPDAPLVLVKNFRANHPRDPTRSVIERPIGIAFSPDGSRVWVANANDDNQGAGHHPAPDGEKNPGSLVSIDPITFAIDAVAEVPNFARFLTFIP